MDFQQQQAATTSGNNAPFFKGTTLWTMAFSTFGGVYKAQASPRVLLDAVSIDGSITVMTYAFISAVVGYGTKKALDHFFRKTKEQ